jgi:hypothetical protein
LHLLIAVFGFQAVAVDQGAGQNDEGSSWRNVLDLPQDVADLQRLVVFLLLVGRVNHWVTSWPSRASKNNTASVMLRL